MRDSSADTYTGNQFLDKAEIRSKDKHKKIRILYSFSVLHVNWFVYFYNLHTNPDGLFKNKYLLTASSTVIPPVMSFHLQPKVLLIRSSSMRVSGCLSILVL